MIVKNVLRLHSYVLDLPQGCDRLMTTSIVRDFPHAVRVLENVAKEDVLAEVRRALAG